MSQLICFLTLFLEDSYEPRGDARFSGIALSTKNLWIVRIFRSVQGWARDGTGILVPKCPDLLSRGISVPGLSRRFLSRSRLFRDFEFRSRSQWGIRGTGISTLSRDNRSSLALPKVSIKFKIVSNLFDNIRPKWPRMTPLCRVQAQVVWKNFMFWNRKRFPLIICYKQIYWFKENLKKEQV